MALLGGVTIEKTLFFLPHGVTAGQVLCHRDAAGCCDAESAKICGGVSLPPTLFITTLAMGSCACLQSTYRLTYVEGVWASSAETACAAAVAWQMMCINGRLSLTGLVNGLPFFTGDGLPNQPVYLHWSAAVVDPCNDTVDVYLVEQLCLDPAT